MLENLNTSAIKPKRVVVLGAGGFVGKHLVENLSIKEIPTLAITRNQVDLLKDNAEHALAECLEPGDALVIISAIAPAKDYNQMIDNLEMMKPVCNVLKNKSPELSQIIYISSDAVYSDEASLVSEDSPKEPTSFHGMMHAARELMLKSVVGNTPFAILRSSILYGVGDPHNSYGPNRFMRMAQQNQTIKLFGGGEETRDHIYIRDVAEVISLVLQHKSKGTMNIATGDSVSFKFVADQVAKVTETGVAVETTERQNPITHRKFDITTCNRAFPKFTYTKFAEGITIVQQEMKELA